MGLKPEKFYHPYLRSSFGIFLDENGSKNGTVGSILNDVNLYYQPLQDPSILLIFNVIKTLILISGVFIHMKVSKMIDKENGLLKDITTLFVRVNTMLWPFLTFFSGIVDFVQPVNQLVGEWFCHSCEFIFYFLWNTMSFHSLVAAIMRYFFIVHRKKVSEYGKEKLKKFFFYLSFLLPFLFVSWESIDGTELDSMSFINKCYGKHHRTFLLESSSLNIAKRYFCWFEDYDSKDTWRQVIALIRRISCIANKIIMSIIFINVIEGFLYWRIWTNINR